MKLTSAFGLTAQVLQKHCYSAQAAGTTDQEPEALGFFASRF